MDDRAPRFSQADAAREDFPLDDEARREATGFGVGGAALHEAMAQLAPRDGEGGE